MPHPLKVRFLSRVQHHLGIEPRSPVRILGYDVHFIGFRQLCFLLGEVFRDGSYYFRCDHRQPLIFDCGSNIGISILYFHSLFPEARIVGFEPCEGVFEVLSRNVAANRLERVTLHQAALWTENGTAELFSNPGQPHGLANSLDRDRVAGAGVSIRAVRLSDYIVERVDFLKMDIEGAELAVLEELQDRDKLCFVDQMAIEYHHHIRREEDRLSDLLRLLERNGFGYQVRSPYRPTRPRDGFQDILVYAYRKQLP